MKEFIIFSAIVLLGSTPLTMIAIRLIFKQSFMTKIGYAFGVVISFCVIATFAILKFGLINSIWAMPIALTITILAFLWLQKNFNVLQDLSSNLEKMSKLEIDAPIDENYLKREDEFGNIANSMAKMITQLNKVVSQVQENSNSVNQMANQLNIISQKISTQSGNQAETTEEIAQAMEEMVATIISNTEKAEYTGKISSQTTKEMNKAKDLILNTLESAAEMSKKSTVISEIARKTDILSINASIEAVKASVEGQGFVVVAEEIRKLSDKTSDSSTEIEELSKRNIDTSKVTSKQLEKIVPEISRSAQLVENIVIASKEQMSRAESINNSIQMLTNISSKNSRNSEDMSLNAQELSNQAKELNNIVAVFKVKKGLKNNR